MFASIYKITKSYQENLEAGPEFVAQIPDDFPPRNPSVSFLGKSLNSRLGVPAGPLLSSSWVSYAARLGYDLLTYKTIRSYEHPSHSLPNILYVDPKTMDQKQVKLASRPPLELDELCITNSFGNPSQAPEFLEQDLPLAKEALKEGQALSVSVYGESLREFVDAIALAKVSGADFIEANFSCPNVKGGGASLYSDPILVYEWTQKLVKSCGDLPLILKVSAFESPLALHECLLAAARGGASAIAGINTLKRVVFNNKGKYAMGPKRPSSGVCGACIRDEGLNFVREAAQFIKKEKLDLALIGMGGIVETKHFSEYLEAGAEIAMTATGMMWNPLLAYHYKTMETGVRQ